MRLSKEGIIDYLNSAFVKEFSLSRDDYLGKPMESRGSHVPRVIFDSLTRPASGLEQIKKVTSASGKTWEIRITMVREGMDVIIQDVSQEEKLRQYIRRYVSADLADLSEDELETFKYPERRYMTVSFTDLRKFTAMSRNVGTRRSSISDE